jgi:acyl carrier protein
MAVKAVRKLRNNIKVSLKDEICPSEGIELFKSILNEGKEQIITSVRDFNYIINLSQEKKIGSKANIDTSSKGERPDLAVEFIEPENEIENAIATIWSNILGLNKIGINDDFFDLGANSIDLVQVKNKIKDFFDVNIPVVELYEFPTIKQLADYISNKEKKSDTVEIIEIKPAQIKDFYPLSAAQESLYILQQIDKNS